MALPSFDAFPAVWIENRNAPEDSGSPEWNFGSCLWSPARDKGGRDRYALMREIGAGDLVLHLLRKRWPDGIDEKRLCAYSIAEAGYEERTDEPPSAGPWAGMRSYYRVPLSEFTELPDPISVTRLASDHAEQIRREIAQEQEKGHFIFATYGPENVRVAQGRYLARCSANLYDLFETAEGAGAGGTMVDTAAELIARLESIPQEVLSSPSASKFDSDSQYPAKSWFSSATSIPTGQIVIKYTTGGRLRHAIGEPQAAELGVFLLEGSLTNRFQGLAEPAVGPRGKFGCALAFEGSAGNWKPSLLVGDTTSGVGASLKALFPDVPTLAVASTMAIPRELNTILYGPPGTGKTYLTMDRALEICGVSTQSRDESVRAYEALVDEGRVKFVTFHQSFSYEDFVEGIRPVVRDDGQISYEPRSGVFREICERASLRQTTLESIESLDGRRFWKMSLGNTRRGEEEEIFEKCVSDGVVRLGWGSGIDFQGANDRDRVFERFEAEDDTIARNAYPVTAVHLFKNEMSIEDIVIVSDGNQLFRAIAEVTGEYMYDPNEEWNHRRDVKWIARFDPSLPSETLFSKNLMQKAIYELRPPTLKLDQLEAMICRPSRSEDAEPCVLIIDEINRANISKVFGEMITLLEPDKRIGGGDERRVTLPYSREVFGVPPNVFVVGTMNTADRSITTVDIALRRRFTFEEVLPGPSLLAGRVVEGMDLSRLLEVLNRRIEFLLDRDHMIGHAYFMDVRTIDDLGDVFKRRVIPLLSEYFHGDLARVAWVLGCGVDEEGEPRHEKPIIEVQHVKASDVLGGDPDFEERLRADLNPDFLAATGDDLADFIRRALLG